MELSKLSGQVYLLKWGGEGRFNKPFIADMHRALDTVLGDPQARMLITTGTGKIYSNGLDLAAITADPDLPPHMFLTQQYFPLLTRLLTLPVLTVAAVQGHAFAGGMVLALAHDRVLMRRDRGFLCMNEVLLPSTVPPGMAEIVMGRVSGFRDRRDCLLFGRRFTGVEARDLGIIDGVADEQELITTALSHADSLSIKDRSIFASIKGKLHVRPLQALQIPEPADTFKHISKL